MTAPSYGGASQDTRRLVKKGQPPVQTACVTLYSRPCRTSSELAAIATYDAKFQECARQLADTGRELAALGWTPATSSNFSMRVSDDRYAITISGRDKGRLGPADIMLIDRDGRPVDTDARPSAETLLHTHVYNRMPDINAVLHTHSRTQTVASRLFAREGTIRLEGYELLKAFAGQTTHETAMDVPVFPNTQDMPELVARVDAFLDSGRPLVGYLIDGHGIYAWGRDMAETRRHLDAFEFLLACELDLRRLGCAAP